MKFLNLIFKTKTVKHQAPEPVGIKPDEHRILQLESQIAGLKLTIENLHETIENQRQLLADSEKNRENIIAGTMDSRLQNLFSSLASPLAQLALQRAIALAGKEIKAENIFKLVSVIENTMEEAGLEQVFQSNEIHPYDAERMNPVMPGIDFAAGENVLVRLPGFVFKGKYICKPLVDKTG